MSLCEEDLADYIDYAWKSILFFLKCGQWSGLKKFEVTQWLENFEYNLIDQYYAHRLLSKLLYYSEEDMEILIKEGIFSSIIGEQVLQKQIEHSFSLTEEELTTEFDTILKNTLFVPVKDRTGPGESGEQISRLLINKLLIETEQVVYSRDIDESHRKYGQLIIVDDCIGSGYQCEDFWSKTLTSESEIINGHIEKMKLRTWCSQNNIRAYYVVLTGYKDSINMLSDQFEDLSICSVEVISDEYRVFRTSSSYWEDQDELKNALQFFSDFCFKKRRPLLGHENLDFALIMHKNIPDWTLPFFWGHSKGFNILMQRKNSYDWI